MSTVVYSRNIDGKTLEFGVSGRLWKNALVMYDRQTQTWWSHITGESLHGPMMGKTLTRENSLRIFPRIRYKEWRSQFPATQVLSIGGLEERPNRYSSYLRKRHVGIGTSAPVDDQRLPHKEVVLGINTKNGSARAYPIKSFKPQRLILDSTGGERLIVIYEPDTGGAAVYSTLLDGKEIDFEPEVRDFIAKDSQGGSWNLLLGEAMDGPLKGKRLKNLPVMEIFWGAWVDYYPKTALWDSGPDSD